MKLLELTPFDNGQHYIPACVVVQHIIRINVSPNGPNGKWVVAITLVDGSCSTEEFNTFAEANDAYWRIHRYVERAE